MIIKIVNSIRGFDYSLSYTDPARGVLQHSETRVAERQWKGWCEAEEPIIGSVLPMYDDQSHRYAVKNILGNGGQKRTTVHEY